MSLHEKAMQAAIKYLELRDYEVFEKKANMIFAYDSHADNIALCKVHASEESIYHMKDISMPRVAFEYEISKFFKSHDELADVVVRFDSIVMSVISQDRAIIRHRVNAGLED